MSSAGAIDRLYLPPSLRYFVPQSIDGRPPGPHACLEYDLVEARRPEMLVDLGAGNAESFSVLCQSMRDHDVDGLAYAVDLWESDEQRQAAGATTWTDINNFLHTHFRGRSYLLKSSPEQVLVHFADRSLDILRIDLRRVEGTPGALLDAWTPKLKPGGVLLCAGLSEREPALDEWRSRWPGSCVFSGGGGLGVAVHELRGTAEPVLLRWLSENDESARKGLLAFYEHAALHQSLETEVQGRGNALFRKKANA